MRTVSLPLFSSKPVEVLPDCEPRASGDCLGYRGDEAEKLEVCYCPCHEEPTLRTDLPGIKAFHVAMYKDNRTDD